MLISYNWLLKEYFKKLPKPEQISEILNLGAFEIEGLEKRGNDCVIDIDVLPNRAHDALCHRGIAKEVATLTGYKFIEPVIDEVKTAVGSDVKVRVDSPVCRRYIAREIQNIYVGKSPKELVEKLEAIGQRSINNIVDITNIVMFEVGQPMHAFDSHKVAGDTIIVRQAVEGETLTTLDNQEAVLTPEDIVIADSESVLAVAGIKGGKRAEVDLSTTDIILEAANFDPVKTRKTSKRIGISTEASKRFENEITPELADEAIALATDLILKYAKTPETKIYESVDVYPKHFRKYFTGVSLEQINSLLGVKLKERKVKEIFEALNFKHEIISPRDVIIGYAKKLIDCPYHYGASVYFDSPERFDCSSFVSYVYSRVGYSIPRISIDQYVAGEKIDRSEALPGDLIFGSSGVGKVWFESQEFLSGTKISASEGIDHVGIYLGEGKVIDASKNNGKVVISNIKDSKAFKDTKLFARYINSNKRFVIEVPKDRLDIKISTDLIEEVGRVYGYSKIKNQEIELPNFKAKENKAYNLQTLIRKILIKNGFSEIITYSFVEKGEIGPEKPIAKDKVYLRPDLEVGMKNSLDKNIKNADLFGLDIIKTFEIGKIFTRGKEDQHDNLEVSEEEVLCLGVIKKVGIKKIDITDFISKVVNEISEMTSAKVNIKIKNEQINGQEAVITSIKIAEILEQIDSLKDYPDFSFPEIENQIYKPISLYPFVLRDIAVWLPSSISKEELLKLIKKESSDLLIKTNLFDEYQKGDKTSYAYHLVFQSSDKTLTDKEVGLIMEKIEEKIRQRDWEVR